MLKSTLFVPKRVVSYGLRALSTSSSSLPQPLESKKQFMKHFPKDIDDEQFIGMTGGEIFHKMLQIHEVDTVFGYPGGAILPAFDAIHDSPHFKFILPRHEQGGGHMAEGYARVTGKPGILLVTSGPGATNTVTPLMDAFMDGTPMICFTGQVPTTAIGSDSFQEADVIGITRQCTKWNVLVKDIKELPRRINEAFYIATSGRPGPVLVDLPKDVTAGVLKTLPDSTPRVAARLYQKETLFNADRHKSSSKEDFNRIADMINNAKKPVIYAGQGIIQSAGACDLLKKLAIEGNIPVTTTLQGLGAFDEEHDLSLRMLGMHGSYFANKAMQNADVIIALGARFDDRVTGMLSKFAPEAKKAEAQGRGGIIHFEISLKNIHKVVHPTETVVGDVGKNLKQLLPHIDGKKTNRTEWFDRINKWKKDEPFNYEADKKRLKSKNTILPQEVIEEFAKQTRHLGENLVISTGVGQHQMWSAQYIKWRHPRTWVSSGGAGTMGFGIPAAIGAQVGAPHKMVVDIDGDASFAMTITELLTAAEYNIPVKILLLNNHFQGMVRTWQNKFYNDRFSATPMHNPRFDEVAKAMGLTGIRLDKREDLESKMKEFLDCKGPVVMDCQVEEDLGVYPMVPAGSPLDSMLLGPDDK